MLASRVSEPTEVFSVPDVLFPKAPLPSAVLFAPVTAASNALRPRTVLVATEFAPLPTVTLLIVASADELREDDTDSEADNNEENDADFEFDEDGAYPMMDSEEEVVRILQRNYGIINEQQEELEQHNHRQELSRKGLGILEKVMEEQKLGEGDYLEMCNIFKELYK